MSWLSILFMVQAPMATTTHYVGDARVRDLMSGQVQLEKVLLRRVVEPARSRIVETACVIHPGRPATVSRAYLTFSGTRIAVSDSERSGSGHLTGTGTASGGSAWAWHELSLDMIYTSPRGSVRIVDVNYLVPGQLVARKTISILNGPPIQLWEADLPETDAAGFSATWREMRCPDATP